MAGAGAALDGGVAVVVVSELAVLEQGTCRINRNTNPWRGLQLHQREQNGQTMILLEHETNVRQASLKLLWAITADLKDKTGGPAGVNETTNL